MTLFKQKCVIFCFVLRYHDNSSKNNDYHKRRSDKYDDSHENRYYDDEYEKG